VEDELEEARTIFKYILKTQDIIKYQNYSTIHSECNSSTIATLLQFTTQFSELLHVSRNYQSL